MKGKIENISIKNSSVKFDSEKHWMLVKDDYLFDQVMKLGKGANVVYTFTWDGLAKKRVLKSIAKCELFDAKALEHIFTPTKEAKQGIETLPELLDALKNPNNEINFFLEQAKNSTIVWNNINLVIEVLKLRARL